MVSLINSLPASFVSRLIAFANSLTHVRHVVGREHLLVTLCKLA